MRNLSVLTVLAGTLALTGCNIEFDGFKNERFQQDFRFSYPLKSGSTFTLENMNGSVDIAGWDREEIEITGTKFARTEALRDEIKIDIQHSDNSANIRTLAPSVSNGGLGARFVIRLPRRVTLDRVTTSNGKIHASDIDGGVRVKSSNGAVELSKLKGTTDAQTSNGSVEANAIEGAVHLHTTNGHITADGVKGALDVSSSNGSISIGMTDGVEGGLQAKTSNASITVRLPATAPARLRVSTSNGNITSAFHTDREGDREERHHLDGNINGGGSGSPLINLSTSNGSVRIEKL
jgi:DUF4097 and DUF4098 domain-containing protein YvlB